MDLNRLRGFVEHTWETDVMPALSEYIAIPCESPAFDPDWAGSGHMDQAVELMVQWTRARIEAFPGATVEVVRLPGRTPLLLVDVPGEARAPVLIYGHLDKQPAMDGWSEGRGAWTPTLEGDRLYGRGGADDGYALFSAITALLALREQKLRHARCILMIEACEESGSADLPYYVEHLAPRLGVPAVIVALDAGCGNYDQLWLTTSLRGQVAGTLTVRVLREGMHSGEASGIVPASFRIARHLLSRLENPQTGEVAPDFRTPIPEARRLQAAAAATGLGDGLFDLLPFVPGARPVTDNLAELALNRTWRPQLTVIGLDGLPAVIDAAAVMQPATSLKLSLRLPPTVDPGPAAHRMKALLEMDAPHGSEVTFQIDQTSKGWNARPMKPWLQISLDTASYNAFGYPAALIGGGGGIPFLAMLGERFPDAQFVVTGVLGPQSNAHGPNEFLHLPTAKRITAVVAHLLHDAATVSVDVSAD